MVGDFAFEAAIIAEIGPSIASDLITFIGTVPFEVDAARGETAIERCFQRPEGHVTSTLSIDLNEGRPAKIEMLFIPGGGSDDPPFSGDAMPRNCLMRL